MMWTLLKRYREILLYLIFGGLTTVVYFVTYYGLSRFVLGTDGYMWATAGAWIISVVFAYGANRKYVFQSKSRQIGREFLKFLGARSFSGALNLALMYLCVDILGIYDLIAAVLGNITVVILNYLFSRFIIFREKKGKTPACTGGNGGEA